ncbi:MAG: virulence RhuM family protein [Synergistaceae bacterium]|nr:virulence RhuM family protein [Synergistaceae bacterium]
MAKIAELFPGVVAEGKVNFELLRSMLGEDVFGDEAYEFTWVGKRAAIAEAGRPIRKTLRPCVDESKNWDKTENLYIEGDNLDVLKLLQESYLGKVKMIYIDPPYNTGNDFIYRDDFAQSREEYDDEAGVYDEDGDRLFRNTETNGRFHSDWCSMMYPRLVLARNFLANDGLIFISIDDNEVSQLRKLCDEVFGEENFIDCLIWKKRYGGGAKEKYLVTLHVRDIQITCAEHKCACDMMSKKKKNEITIRSSAAEYLTFITASGEGGVEAIYADENVWLSQKMMAELYNVNVRTVNEHLKKIFSDSELEEDSVIRNFRITASDGKTYSTKHYNLKAIIAVGYKTNSERAVQFRKWATNIIEEYTVKAYVMDDERLKSGSILTNRYFEEQLERIREIKLSELKFYQRITDIYATSIDYKACINHSKFTEDYGKKIRFFIYNFV